MGGWLDCYAGSRILGIVRDEGLDWDRVRVLLGAAGGPKWLVLYGLDRVLCQEWIWKRKAPLDCLGASIGAWRFAAYCQADPGAALERFLEAYRGQSYSMKPTPAEVSRVLREVLRSFVDAQAARDIATQANRRLHILAVRGRALLNAEASLLVGLGLAGASLANSVHPKGLRWFFERTIFSHAQSSLLHEIDHDRWPVRRVPMEARNVVPALLASGSIPLLMEPVRNIPGTPPGAYWDGGLTDYHVTVPLCPSPGRIVLYPHYTDRLVPGWFDKRFSRRRPDASRLADVLLLVPSRRFVAQLPYGRIPDREDFWVFAGRDSQRLRFWDTVIAASRALGEEFMEWVHSGKIRDRVRPMDALWARR